MSPADQNKYPKFTRYIKLAVPQLIKVPVIVTNVRKYGGLTPTEFKNAVAWGNDPNIVITDLHHGQCGVPKAYGCFRHTKPKNLEIHIGVVQDFEKVQSGNTDKNAKGKSVYVVGATLLHELCHWGNFNNVPRIPEIKEMGEEFEKATYGKIIY